MVKEIAHHAVNVIVTLITLWLCISLTIVWMC